METFLMQLQSFLIVLLMILGLLNRKKIKAHITLMSTAIIWDIVLILQIELSRSAILKASQAMKNAMALNIHVTIAVLTVVMYGFMVASGRKMLSYRQNHSSLNAFDYKSMKNKHKTMGIITFSLRLLTFITSFWAVTPK